MEIPGGLTSTYRGNSEGLNLNVGLTISSGIGNVSVGGSAGINKSWSNSKSNIFITDANGDYLPDLSVNNRILFNYIDFDDNNITKFSSSSDSTENLIVKGSEITVDPPETKVENEYKLPAFDVVKVWEAPHDGTIIIENGLVSQGAKVSIETDNNGFYGHGSPTSIGLVDSI
ncbi:MAG: hypothetical protein IPH93_16625 [Saprospiraceae bacterium]|nr:hypothetical protein [Saprospiraceae bacterium]